jgi:hypothetical protein
MASQEGPTKPHRKPMAHLKAPEATLMPHHMPAQPVLALYFLFLNENL